MALVSAQMALPSFQSVNERMRKKRKKRQEKRKEKENLACGEVLDAVLGNLGPNPPKKLVLGGKSVPSLGDVVPQNQSPDQTQDQLQISVD